MVLYTVRSTSACSSSTLLARLGGGEPLGVIGGVAAFAVPISAGVTTTNPTCGHRFSEAPLGPWGEGCTEGDTPLLNG